MGLTTEQQAAYARDGVTRLGPVLDEADLAEARGRFDRLFRERAGSTDRGLRELYGRGAAQRHYQFYNIWQHDDWFRGLLSRPALLDFVEAVLGPNLQLLHDQVFFKPAGDGAPSLWHQDNSYWNFAPPHLASIWIALDDVDEENSCLYFLPGSHREGAREPRRVTLPSGTTVFELDVDESQLRPFPMPAGHALMHHCLTIHGAHPNRSNRGRRSIGIHYMDPAVTDREGNRRSDRQHHPLLRGRAPS